MIRIGRDVKHNNDVYIETKRSRAVLICGKRGSGKSYSLGAMVEQIFDQENSVSIIVDPMGIYHTMGSPNADQEKLLWEWGMTPEGFPVSVLVPGDPVERYGGADIVQEMEKRGVSFRELRLNPGEITPEEWCETFRISINDPMGITIHKAIRKCRQELGVEFSIEKMTELIEEDTRANESTKDALINRLQTADQDWGIFSRDRYIDLWDVFETGAINVLDLSTIGSGRYGRRPLILGVLLRNLFSRRAVARRREELGLQSLTPKIWLFIDEAQQFAPSSSSTLAKDALIRWIKEGRQPGLSLALSTQQPSALDMEILSQCDVILSHSLTSALDKNSLNKLTKDYMKAELGVFIERVTKPGEAVMVDDLRETVEFIKVAPKKSLHGGGEA